MTDDSTRLGSTGTSTRLLRDTEAAKEAAKALAAEIAFMGYTAWPVEALRVLAEELDLGRYPVPFLRFTVRNLCRRLGRRPSPAEYADEVVAKWSEKQGKYLAPRENCSLCGGGGYMPFFAMASDPNERGEVILRVGIIDAFVSPDEIRDLHYEYVTACACSEGKALSLPPGRYIFDRDPVQWRMENCPSIPEYVTLHANAVREYRQARDAALKALRSEPVNVEAMKPVEERA